MAAPSAPPNSRRGFSHEFLNRMPAAAENTLARLPSESARQSPESSPSLDQVDAEGFRNTYPAPYSPRPSLHKSPGKSSSYFNLRSTLSSGTATPMLEEDVPKGQPRGENDLGRPTMRSRNASVVTGHTPFPTVLEEFTPITHSVPFDPPSTSLPLELLTSILIPLPYLLGSLVKSLTASIDYSKHSSSTEVVEELLEEVASTAVPVTSRNSSLLEAFALASGTLLILGILGQFQRNTERGQRQRASSTTPQAADSLSPTSSLLTWTNAKRFLSRIAAVGLPFLASVELGGARTGLFLLAGAAEGLIAPETRVAATSKWRKVLHSHKWIALVFVISLLADLFYLAKDKEPSSIIRGYAALVKPIMLLRSPLPASSSMQSQKASSPLISSVAESTITLVAGLVLMITTFIAAFMLSAMPNFDGTSALLYTLTLIASTGLFTISSPALLRSSGKRGLALGLILCVCFSLTTESLKSAQSLALVCLGGFAYVAVQVDTFTVSRPTTTCPVQVRKHNHSKIKASRFTMFLIELTEDWPLLHSILSESDSRRIAYFMSINLIFMFVQTFYSVVSGSLGLLSDSIHMLFDCIGLFAGLVAAVMSKWPPNTRFPYGYGKVEVLSGLGNGIFLMIISVEIIWESFERVLEGAELKRMNELLIVSVGGLLVNLIGLFFTGGHHHHVHSHSNHDSHNHEEAHHLNDVASSPKDGLISHEKQEFGSATSSSGHKPDHHYHHHHHHHHGSNENMAGIYLHILADTMGSVAVIISTFLTKYTNWYGWDPIASCVIAVLIILASYPLVISSAQQLLLTLPEDVEYILRNTLQGISAVHGVSGYAVPRFWLDERHVEEAHTRATHSHSLSHDRHSHAHTHAHHNGHIEPVDHDSHDLHPEDHKHEHMHEYEPVSNGNFGNHEKSEHPHEVFHGPKLLGVIHILATPRSDLEDVRKRVEDFLKGLHMDVLVHVEREGSSRCWCSGTMQKGHTRNSSTIPM